MAGRREVQAVARRGQAQVALRQAAEPVLDGDQGGGDRGGGAGQQRGGPVGDELAVPGDDPGHGEHQRRGDAEHDAVDGRAEGAAHALLPRVLAQSGQHVGGRAGDHGHEDRVAVEQMGELVRHHGMELAVAEPVEHPGGDVDRRAPPGQRGRPAQRRAPALHADLRRGDAGHEREPLDRGPHAPLVLRGRGPCAALVMAQARDPDALGDEEGDDRADDPAVPHEDREPQERRAEPGDERDAQREGDEHPERQYRFVSACRDHPGSMGSLCPTWG